VRPDGSRWGRGALALPAFGWTAVFFFVPLGILVVYSFAQIDVLTLQIRFEWTTENYTRIADSLYLETIVRSLAIALATTLACLVIGFPVAYFISRQQGTPRILLLLAVMVPFWTIFVVRTYAWVNLLSNGGPIEDGLSGIGLVDGSLDLLYTPGAVAIGMIYSYLPLMILPLFVALDRVDRSIEQAAADLGASGFRTFRRVTFPLAMPGVVAGCVLVGVPASGEFVIPAILGGEKTLLYGNVVAAQFLQVGDYPFGAALAVSLMLFLTVVLLAARLASARSEELAT
jgi:spermidine/putrescine transport system permease protein